MRRLVARSFIALLVLATLVAAAGSASAQIDSGEIQIVDLNSEDYPEVELVVDVPQSFADEDLSSRQFALQEGGVRRTIEVEKLRESTAIVLAIDTSGSMSGDPLFVAQQSALAFIDGLPAQHPVAVVGFGDVVTVASELTTDRDVTRSAIQGLISGGETTLFDALVTSAGLLDQADDDRFSTLSQRV